MIYRFLFGILILLSSCAGLRDIKQSSAKTSVNLSQQRLTEVPIELKGNQTIKVLKLYGNQITELPEWIGDLVSLEKLYIGKNKLTKFPHSIGKLKNLKLLSAQYNEIDSLPSSIGQLQNLEQLILNQNKLTRLPSELGDLKKLEVLQLKFNALKTLPESIGNCEEMQFIYLNRNNLEEIPSSFGNMRKLRELHVSGAGPLLNIPESMCGLRYLEVLEIDHAIVIPTCLLVLQTNRLKIIVN